MEKYEDLELNIIVFEANDVITESQPVDPEESRYTGQEYPVT